MGDEVVLLQSASAIDPLDSSPMALILDLNRPDAQQAVVTFDRKRNPLIVLSCAHRYRKVCALRRPLTRAAVHKLLRGERETPGRSFPAVRKPLRILIAEDNPVNRKVMQLILEREGHTVVVAEDGGSAYRQAQDATFDLLLMDLQMPDMNGLEATALIRKFEREHGEPRVPIVALTARALEEDRQRCLSAEMDGY